MTSLKSTLARLKDSTPYRAWKRYTGANGNLLAAGVGYFAFFSIFPALALAFTIFGIVLQGRPDLIETIANSLNETLPGMVKTADHPDGIIALSAPSTTTLTLTGIISVVTLLFAGLGWIRALRTGIRGIFGLAATTGNMILSRLRDVAVLLTLGLGIALSAILTSVVGGLGQQIAAWLGWDGGWLITVSGLLVGVAFDTLLMAVLLRYLSGVPLPWVNIRNGAVLGAVALMILKFFGASLIARTTSNPVLGTVAASVGLLVWLNLMSRVVLLSAAWSANDVDIARLAGDEADREAAEQEEATPILTSGPYAVRIAPSLPASRAQDRVTLAAGAVLGAVATAVLGAVRTVRDRGRR